MQQDYSYTDKQGKHTMTVEFLRIGLNGRYIPQTKELASHFAVIDGSLAGNWWDIISTTSPLGEWFTENVFINPVEADTFLEDHIIICRVG